MRERTVSTTTYGLFKCYMLYAFLNMTEKCTILKVVRVVGL